MRLMLHSVLVQLLCRRQYLFIWTTKFCYLTTDLFLVNGTTWSQQCMVYTTFRKKGLLHIAPILNTSSSAITKIFVLPSCDTFIGARSSKHDIYNLYLRPWDKGFIWCSKSKKKTDNTKPCTHFHSGPSNSTQLISTSTQLHTPPPSSFSLHPVLCNTLNVIRTKISHVIGQFP